MIRKKKYDIIIIGGGLAGMTQALLLGNAGFKTLCLDQGSIKDQIKSDERTTAISYGSSKILEKAGIWEDIAPHGCPITDIQILDGDSPVLLDFDVADLEKSALGWIFDNGLLRTVMAKTLKKNKNCTHIENAKLSDVKIDEHKANAVLEGGKNFEAKLIIGADGRRSKIRTIMGVKIKEWSYDQTAIIATITHEKPHQNIAVEHFKSEGPFAILPMNDNEKNEHRSAIVWTLHGGNEKPYVENDNLFLVAMRERFPAFYGDVLKTGKRMAYPLGLVHAHNYVTPRMALIADAAHGIHPIAGQGLNLGLRDADALYKILTTHKDQDFGTLDVLKEYETARRSDNTAMAVATDMLNKLFSNNMKSVNIVRSTGLKLIEKIAPAKKFFMKQAMGLKKAP